LSTDNLCRPFSNLDWIVPEFLDQLFVEEPQFLVELVQLYIQGTTANLALLQEQISLGNKKAVSETLHALKGSCRQMGAMKMGDILDEMEESLVSGGGDATCESLVTLEAAFHSVRWEMEDGIIRLDKRHEAKHPRTDRS
jgi:HPt (histidine-containing phosphotransfer) domain-containing protein